MKYLTIESFVNSLNEEELWKIIDEYESWVRIGSDDFQQSFLRDKAREFCSNLTIPARYHTDFMSKIAIGAYRHFTLKYKEMMK
jgi:type I restriction-modification system DNA methylase subunit